MSWAEITTRVWHASGAACAPMEGSHMTRAADSAAGGVGVGGSRLGRDVKAACTL